MLQVGGGGALSQLPLLWEVGCRPERAAEGDSLIYDQEVSVPEAERMGRTRQVPGGADEMPCLGQSGVCYCGEVIAGRRNKQEVRC